MTGILTAFLRKRKRNMILTKNEEELSDLQALKYTIRKKLKQLGHPRVSHYNTLLFDYGECV
jgi:hypothetical protein